MIQLDVDYVFQRLGGARGVLALINKHLPQHQLNYPAVQMWRSRKRVSALWLPGLIYALNREGIVLAPCFLDDQEFEQ